MKKEKEERKIEKEIKTKTCLGGEEEQQQKLLLYTTIMEQELIPSPVPCAPKKTTILQSKKMHLGKIYEYM
jgi:hypothetical protein